jgi:sugar (pentulose or hexulose) kinase
MSVGCIAVLDVGKTLAKLSLWDASGGLVERHERLNERVYQNGTLFLDTQGIERWLINRLTVLGERHGISAIVPVAHGAAAALVRGDTLASAPLDYENPIPAATRARYSAQRDCFAVTGSPALANGLNLGLQLAWLEEQTPALLSKELQIVPWPQYWAWRLSGTVATELTSLGCHTDLWNPHSGCPSPLAAARGWDLMFAPLRRADESLGSLRPALAAQTGLSAHTKILCGMHDSNAALHAVRGIAGIGGDELTLLSTGTWFVAMRSQANSSEPLPMLAERRDCLINVDVRGAAVPSARFMGGREIELLLTGQPRSIDHFAHQAAMLAAAAKIIAQRIMMLPTQTPGVGPFPNSMPIWRGRPESVDAQCAAVALYAALNVDAMLELLGTRSCIVIDGRFAKSQVLARALAALWPDCQVFVSDFSDGVAAGALRLALPTCRAPFTLEPVEPLDADMRGYRQAWRSFAMAA